MPSELFQVFELSALACTERAEEIRAAKRENRETEGRQRMAPPRGTKRKSTKAETLEFSGSQVRDPDCLVRKSTDEKHGKD